MGNIEYTYIEGGLIVYFIINSFMAGQQSMDWQNGRAKMLMFMFISFLFGTAILVIALIYSYIKKIGLWLDNTFQMGFWFTYTLGIKKWDNLSEESLRLVNNAAKSKKSNSIRHRNFRHVLGIINKLNNYKPPNNGNSL